MIQQESFFLSESKTGVTFYIFSDIVFDLLPEIPDQYKGPYPTYVVYDGLGVVDSFHYFTGGTIWTRNDNNNYIPLDQSNINYITGKTIVQTVESDMSQENIDSMVQNILDRISDPTRLGTPPSASAATNYVFYEKKAINDFYVDLKVQRTYNSLDTLKIYNNLVNSFPEQESPTGVVFGRLMAVQKIKDVNGQNMRIPLVNVPIGIFNPAPAPSPFTDTFSTDENGNRLSLNIKESAVQNQYFNDYSYFEDYEKYMISANQFSGVPAQYKYITKTNENGEFILYDIPVGQQVVIFEVDLFKQGLTKDEIALNFFPFPDTDEPNIDSIPSFVYKQFPIDVVPAWGLGQTGYTSLDININLDLRKWATFYVAPIAFNGYEIQDPEIATLSDGVLSMNIDIRDMSKQGYPTTNIPVVQIPDILAKDANQALFWQDEFIQQTSTIKFATNNFQAFKVRANLYDPNGYRTDVNGFPTLSNNPYSKGVWLAAYQFLMYFNQRDKVFRVTGFQRDWGFPINSWIGRDHFHLNRGVIQDTKNASTPPSNSFPYEKPWSLEYPTPYSIPRKPTQLNFVRNNYSTRLTDSSGNAYLEQPLYKDGDLVGAPYVSGNSVEDAGGYGVQRSYNSSIWFPNSFAQRVAKNYIYKYERGVSWAEKYSNGYEPSNSSFPIQPNISYVHNGEQYQRVECGYGYWLRPEGWPPIAFAKEGDVVLPSAVNPINLSTNNGPNTLNVGLVDSLTKTVIKANNIFVDTYNVEQKRLSASMGSKIIFEEGSLDIYRIIDTNSLAAPNPPVIPTFTIFNFGPIYAKRGPSDASVEARMAYDNSVNDTGDRFFSIVGGSGHADVLYEQYLKIKIKNDGLIPVTLPNGTKIEPLQVVELSATDLGINNLELTLPGNSDFDFTSNKYTKSRYSFTLTNIRLGKSDGSAFFPSSLSDTYDKSIFSDFYTSGNIPLDAYKYDAAEENIAPNYYLQTKLKDVKTNFNKDDDSCKSDSDNDYTGVAAKWKNDVIIFGMAFLVRFEASPSKSFGSLRFSKTNINSVCGEKDYNGIISIPIEPLL